MTGALCHRPELWWPLWAAIPGIILTALAVVCLMFGTFDVGKPINDGDRRRGVLQIAVGLVFAAANVALLAPTWSIR